MSSPIWTFDLTEPTMAYLYGFVQTDGHLWKSDKRGKGKLSLEIATVDREILVKFRQFVAPLYSSVRDRKRDTNFKKDFEASCWTISRRCVCDMFNAVGMPYGKKDRIQILPLVPYSEIDFFRGVIDANGSLGFTVDQYPFVSLATSSRAIAEGFTDFLNRVAPSIKGRGERNRNSRDDSFNVATFGEGAVEVVKELYYDGCLALLRKQKIAASVIGWIPVVTV